MLTASSGARRLKIHSLRTTANKSNRNIFREDARSAVAGFHTLVFTHWFSVLYPGRFGVLVFVEGGKREKPEQKPSKQGENKKQTQSTYDTGPESNTGHIGGKRALSPLSHPCSPKLFGETSRIGGPYLPPKHTCSGIPTVHC